MCGGESKRMGSDKGLLPIGRCNWAQHAAQKFDGLNVPVVISVNQSQLPAYTLFFNPGILICDQVPAKGPLAGLLSVHVNYPDDDLIVLACDMTHMDTTTLQFLQRSSSEFPGFDYYSYSADGFMEPLCAVYTSKSLRILLQTFENRNLMSFSLHQLIRQGRYKALPIENIEKFKNYNTSDCLCKQS